MRIFAPFSLILWITLLTFARSQENSVQAVSEGSDCRCKCILTTKDGGPCDGSLVGGQRRITYLVETISGGRDCRCSCNTPPPGGCDTPANFIFPDKDSETSSNSQEINLVELHSSISNMVAAMVKLEKSVTEKSSEKDIKVMRQNIQKVVSKLKSTNGSYEDLLEDLDLNSVENHEQEGENIGETKATPAPEVEATTTKDVVIKIVEPSLVKVVHNEIGVTPSTTTTKRTQQISLASTQNRSSPTEKTITPTYSELQTTNTSTGTIQPIPVLAEKPSLQNNLESSQPGSKTKSSRTPEDLRYDEFDEFSTVGKSTSKKPIEQGFSSPKKPKVLFVPYRAVQKKKPTTTTTKPEIPTTTPGGKVEEEYEYEYEYFDVDIKKVQTKTTTTAQETTVPSTEKSTTITEQIVEVAPTTNTSNPTTTVLNTSTTKKVDDYYSEYLEQYEDDDEYEYDYDVTDKPNTTTTTTTATTTTNTQTTTPYKPDPCGTLLSFSKPRKITDFGRREGAWMRDPVPSDTDRSRSSKIYIANFYYGSNLIEFDSVESIRELRYQNSYNLPHKWIGTGHIVYNGSFYYNRAFSRTLIKYNLKYRFVSAWSRLTNAVYDPTYPFTWRGHSMVHVVADEDGLWVIFPARDPFDPYATLTYVINKINPVDLRILESHKSKIRQSVSHVFMICGVVYSTDRYNSRNARVTHAFDTRSQVQRSFYIGFENLYSYSVQFSYNPKERKIYAWDNGHQVEYRVNLMH